MSTMLSLAFFHRPSSISITAGKLLPEIWCGGPSLRLMNEDAVLHVDGIFVGSKTAI